MLSTNIRQKQGFSKNNFTRTFNLNHVINLSKFTRIFEKIRSNELK